MTNVSKNTLFNIHFFISLNHCRSIFRKLNLYKVVIYTSILSNKRVSIIENIACIFYWRHGVTTYNSHLQTLLPSRCESIKRGFSVKIIGTTWLDNNISDDHWSRWILYTWKMYKFYKNNYLSDKTLAINQSTTMLI